MSERTSEAVALVAGLFLSDHLELDPRICRLGSHEDHVAEGEVR